MCKFHFFFSTVANMEGPEVTFLFQFGNLRDMVTVPASTINLKTLKDLACDFINSKVSGFLFHSIHFQFGRGW